MRPHYMGYKVILNPNLVKVEVIERSWRERLLTWPWRPWTRLRSVASPSEEAIVVGGTMTLHPDLWERLRHATSAV